MANADLTLYRSIDDLLTVASRHIEDTADIVRNLDDSRLREAFEGPVWRSFDEVAAAKRLLLTALVEVEEAAERYHALREKWEDEHAS